MAQQVGEAADAETLVRVGPEALSHDAAVAFVTTDDCGAVATFLGVTRDSFEGKRVVRLSYEAYVPMAEAKMRAIAAAARSKFGVRRVACLHRVGEVGVGEASVVIAMASPHRRDALSGVAWAIDELKATVPIWKKEFFEGGEVWKENAEQRREPREPPRRKYV